MSGGKDKKGKKQEQEPLFLQPVYASSVAHNLNHDCTRLSNAHFIDEYTFLTAAGNTVQFVDVSTRRTSWLVGRDGGGVGAVCVHPERVGAAKAAKYFAVAEKTGVQSAPLLPRTAPNLPRPRVYIYEYPSKRLYKQLRDGTEQLYTAASFSSRGDKIATVGGANDYMLTVWNWEQESVILRFKAWGSEVFRVTFNPYDDGFLTTSGVGHMKFWEMAKTFTGLKLKGDIGKFGKVDIQDVSGYAELPDGKVLSGSESGRLLLWEAALIKTELQVTDGESCHEGPIEVVELLEEPPDEEGGNPKRIFMSAGHDGYMKYWRFSDVDMADTTEEKPVFEMDCVRSVLIDESCSIKAVSKGPTHWLIQDMKGAYWRTKVLDYDAICSDAPSPPSEVVVRFHAGAITCVEASPSDHSCVTGGSDGTLRMWDYINRREMYTSQFSAGVTFLFWAPSSADPGCSTIVAGFSNGVVRVLQRSKVGFVIRSVCKPHTKEVRAVAFNPAYTWAASASKDGTVFFFQVTRLQQEWTPVGQSKLPHEPTCAFWESAERCVIGLANGDIIGVERPDPASIDPDVTFIFQCKYNQLLYHQRPRPKEKEKKKRGALDELEDLDEPDPEEEEEEEEETAAEDQGPFPINDLLQLDRKLLVALNHTESAYDYAGLSWTQAGHEAEAEYPISNISYFKTTVRKLRMSSSRKYLVLGCEDGQILLRDALGKGASPLKKVWHVPLAHDGRRDPPRQGGNVHSGSITGVATSYDDSMLLSCSMDGSFFAHKLGEVDAAEPEPVPAGTPQYPKPIPLPDAPESVSGDHADAARWAEAQDEVPDIDSIDALSIQEKKVKDDEDRARIAAERKRMSLRDRVRELQDRYEEIVHANASAPKGKQVSKDDLQLDPEVTELLHQENHRRVEDVVMRFAWETERAELSRQKLEAVYLKTLKVERITLWAFRSGKCVSSFRTPELTNRQMERIEKVHQLISQEEQRRAAMHRDPAEVPEPGSPGAASAPPRAVSGLSQGPSPGGSTASPRDLASTDNFDEPAEVAEDVSGIAKPARGSAADLNQTESSLMLTQKSKSKKDEKPQPKSQLEKAEERKKERADRRSRHDALLERKPQAEHEDPRDLQLIQKAERSMGDRKLKNDPSYVVKEHERMTAERKERQLILLEESINTLRMDFNDRFLAMRDLKERLISNINRDLKHITKINKQLSGFGVKVDEKIEVFSMKDCEQPDKLRAQPPSKDELARYQKEQEKAARKKLRLARAAAGGDVLAGSDSDDDEKGGDDADGKHHGGAHRKTSIAKFPRRESAVITAQMRYNIEMQGRLDSIQRSALEEEEDTIRRIQLEYEKSKLQRKIDKTITTFDEALDELRREKFKLEGDLKMADMRVLLLYRELVLLKIFKSQDEQLSKRLEDIKNDKADVTVKTNHCQEKLNERKVEIKRLLEREQDIMNDMLKVMGQVPQEIRDQLMKIFRRKVKRKARKDGEGEEEEEEEEESSSEDDWGDDDDDQAQEDEEDVCPDGCDEDTYQAVLELRNRRLDQEDIVNDFQKSIDLLKKENEALTVRERKTNGALAKVEKEIDTFQAKKQRDLNKLETVVVLKLNQVRCLNQEWKIPFDGNQLVVFTNGGMHELSGRILQLQNDKKTLRKDFELLRKTRRALDRDKKQAEELVKQWEQRVYEVQLLKFGQKVDLESLEDVSVDRQTEELKLRLRAEESKWERAMRVQQHALKKLKERQQQVTTENSTALQNLANLRQDQQRLEGQLNVSQNKILTRMAGGSRIATASDRANLKDLVVMQQREIDALKNEIAMLRRKGGHVYTPVVSRVVTEAAAGAGPDDRAPAAQQGSAAPPEPQG
eukprot:TRINITY_DN15100_c0_g2_i1.p1 TRINITY_DN15100_c0_g2~~TRINITY_DN15100_c0_g2_i1.p1  ORF type:complete len:1845 (+),score=929.68 TRINITY_DN15100_c0_g2_i1:115-5649(+)